MSLYCRTDKAGSRRPWRGLRAPALARRRAGGFTLLEILLTTVLSAALLGILWGLFSVYLRLFETGQAKAQQQQLVRALLQQLTDDLHSALEDSPAEGARGTSAGVRRFGLLGSSDSLRFDVLQVIPLEETPHLETDVSQRLVGAAATPQVPELRTIYYTFADPDNSGINRLASAGETLDEATQPNRNARPGLTRRELDYETPDGERPTNLSGGSSSAGVAAGSTGVTYVLPTEAEIGDSAAGLSAAAEPTAGQSLETEVEDDSLIWLPEVAQLEFRYFDGKAWSSEWDSLQRKSLPVAVEVAIRMRYYDPSQQDLPAVPTTASTASPAEAADSSIEGNILGGETLLGDNALLEDDADSSGEGLQYDVLQPTAEDSVYRLVIDIPSARLHPVVQRPQSTSGIQPLTAAAPPSTSPLQTPTAVSLAPLSAPARLARPLIRPLGASTPSATVSRADQWMRAEH